MKIALIFFSTALGLLGIAFANDATPKLHPTEAACVDYELTGDLQNGNTTRCHRDYAYELYEIQNVTMGIAGFTQSTNQHTITIGEWIYAINLDTNTGTKTENPMYDGLVAALENQTPEQMTAQFMATMGLTANGETKTIAGENCAMYTSQMMGKVCMTEGGLMLEQTFMGNTQTATSVSIGDSGDDANYTLYQNVPITDGPDIGAIMDMMNQGNN